MDPAGSRKQSPGGHGSWATSHWETARDQRIRAARFTTRKMKKGSRTPLVTLSFFLFISLGRKQGCQSDDVIHILTLLERNIH